MAKPTADEVTRRLREAAGLSRNAPHRPTIDYSAESVTARLRELADVSELCARLVALGAEHRGRAAR